MYHQIKLTQSFNILGNIRELPDSTSEVNTESHESVNEAVKTVTGVTENRLEEIRSYNIQMPYIVGVNGVLSVEEDTVVYQLDGITYTTTIEDGTTTYSFGYVGLTQALNTHFFYRNEHDVFIDKKPTKSDIIMQRSEKSVFDPMLIMATVNSLDDLADFFK